MVAVDWEILDGTTMTGLCGLLTCGHFSGPVHEASSVWDFPDEAHGCPTCGEDRQLDLRLQAALVADDDWGIPFEDRRAVR